MIVLDASAMVEVLVGAEPSEELLRLLKGDIHVPHLLDVDVTRVARTRTGPRHHAGTPESH